MAPRTVAGHSRSVGTTDTDQRTMRYSRIVVVGFGIVLTGLLYGRLGGDPATPEVTPGEGSDD